jgi:hypothetical protein
MSDAMTNETAADARAEHAIETARAWTRRAGRLGKRAAERLPAGVVVVVGGTVLLAADAFGIGEVITAGVAGYGAYRMLRRRARRREEAQQRAPEQLAAQQQPTEQTRSEQRAMEAQP